MASGGDHGGQAANQTGDRSASERGGNNASHGGRRGEFAGGYGGGSGQYGGGFGSGRENFSGNAGFNDLGFSLGRGFGGGGGFNGGHSGQAFNPGYGGYGPGYGGRQRDRGAPHGHGRRVASLHRGFGGLQYFDRGGHHVPPQLSVQEHEVQIASRSMDQAAANHPNPPSVSATLSQQLNQQQGHSLPHVTLVVGINDVAKAPTGTVFAPVSHDHKEDRAMVLIESSNVPAMTKIEGDGGQKRAANVEARIAKNK
ncbi:glycine-rich protein 2-like [Phragmites australis]|uniref:glycine-rich protein 2-like n=1 Tax=Phragmites australis TaxID=29695 RepID=UPI002D788310|nr:glycine-rich protein 2-like [Phragmites australis]